MYMLTATCSDSYIENSKNPSKILILILLQISTPVKMFTVLYSWQNHCQKFTRFMALF